MSHHRCLGLVYIFITRMCVVITHTKTTGSMTTMLESGTPYVTTGSTHDTPTDRFRTTTYEHTSNQDRSTQKTSHGQVTTSYPTSQHGSSTANELTTKANIDTDTSTDIPTSSAVDTTISSAVDTTISSAVDTTISRAVDTTISSAVDTTTSSAVDTTISSAIDTSTSSAVDTSTSSAVDTSTSSAVDTTTSNAVDTSIGTDTYTNTIGDIVTCDTVSKVGLQAALGVVAGLLVLSLTLNIIFLLHHTRGHWACWTKLICCHKERNQRGPESIETNSFDAHVADPYDALQFSPGERGITFTNLSDISDTDDHRASGTYTSLQRPGVGPEHIYVNYKQH